MIVQKRAHGYSSRRKYVQGKGFIDNLTSSLKSVGSYISQNRNLIAKPLLEATGNLAAFGIEEGGKALFKHIINKNNKNNKNNQEDFKQLDPKGKAILQSIAGTNPSIPVTNIIGSGIKRF
jgi:hypothetical protein